MDFFPAREKDQEAGLAGLSGEWTAIRAVSEAGQHA